MPFVAQQTVSQMLLHRSASPSPLLSPSLSSPASSVRQSSVDAWLQESADNAALFRAQRAEERSSTTIVPASLPCPCTVHPSTPTRPFSPSTVGGPGTIPLPVAITPYDCGDTDSACGSSACGSSALSYSGSATGTPSRAAPPLRLFREGGHQHQQQHAPPSRTSSAASSWGAAWSGSGTPTATPSARHPSLLWMHHGPMQPSLHPVCAAISAAGSPVLTSPVSSLGCSLSLSTASSDGSPHSRQASAVCRHDSRGRMHATTLDPTTSATGVFFGAGTAQGTADTDNNRPQRIFATSTAAERPAVRPAFAFPAPSSSFMGHPAMSTHDTSAGRGLGPSAASMLRHIHPSLSL